MGDCSGSCGSASPMDFRFTQHWHHLFRSWGTSQSLLGVALRGTCDRWCFHTDYALGECFAESWLNFDYLRIGSVKNWNSHNEI